METVIINARTKAEVKWLMELARRINAPAKTVDTETIEDAHLASLIAAGLKTESVPREEVMKALER